MNIHEREKFAITAEDAENAEGNDGKYFFAEFFAAGN